MQEKLLKLEKRYEELEQLLASYDATTDKDQYNKYARELAALREPVSLFRQLRKTLEDIHGLEGVLLEQHDKEFLDLARAELERLTAQRIELESKIETATAEEDTEADRDCIVEIRQGTGGDEAGLFAADLYRMYTLYAANRQWVIEFLSGSENEAKGLKEVSFSVKGKEAYKRLKFESGVHRVQRVPATEAQGRIHTSTATVAVLMEAEEVDLVIESKDLRIDTYRSSGPGGQHMQKTDSAVRITHIPSGTVVACQDERSQLKNKTKAMRILRAKILDNRRAEEARKISQARKIQVGSGDRSEKIRTYNFPDRRVTDHRINFTSHRLENILNGDMDELFTALIKAEQEQRQNNERS